MRNRHLTWFAVAALAAVPGLAARLAGIALAPPAAAMASGSAIIGASFLLLWACDAAQVEISQALSLAIVALIAVLPEYSVDMYFTWQAGAQPGAGYEHYTIANMTGANRLLIGVAWGAIVAVYWFRFRRPVRIEKDRRTELLFLGAATLYAFVIPLKGTLEWVDGAVLLALYGWYIYVAARRCCGECEVEGPAELLVRLPKARRRLATLATFLFAAAVILANAAPFCEGLLGTGKAFHISEFVLVQWLAPIASEAPEFVVALVFAWRGQAGLALGSLLSAKLNQWTLLVGMIPGVYALSSGTFARPIPLGPFQMNEILLTAAQSLLGLVLLAGLRLAPGGALLLFGLFAGQLFLPAMHSLFAALYLVAAAALFLERPRPVLSLIRPPAPVPTLAPPCAVTPEGEFRTPHCRTCKWRLAATVTSAPVAG
jgi:cation:H+ antiporter